MEVVILDRGLEAGPLKTNPSASTTSEPLSESSGEKSFFDGKMNNDLSLER